MIILKNEELMKEFYEENKAEFPDMSLEEMRDICFEPWRFVRKEMQTGELPTIRLKYFGTFQVYMGRAKNMLLSLSNKVKQGYITEDKKKSLEVMLTKFIEKNEQSN